MFFFIASFFFMPFGLYSEIKKNFPFSFHSEENSLHKSQILNTTRRAKLSIRLMVLYLIPVIILLLKEVKPLHVQKII